MFRPEIPCLRYATSYPVNFVSEIFRFLNSVVNAAAINDYNFDRKVLAAFLRFNIVFVMYSPSWKVGIIIDIIGFSGDFGIYVLIEWII